MPLHNETPTSEPDYRGLSRRFILFAAAIRQATSGEVLSKKMGFRVTDSQADALRFLALNDNVTVGEIAIGLGHTMSGATKAINRLEKNGWVERLQGGVDHRTVYVRLTPEGQRLANLLLTETEDRLRRILMKLRPETVERLKSVFEEFLWDYIDDEHVAARLCVACGFEGGINCCDSNQDCVVAQVVKSLESDRGVLSVTGCTPATKP